MSDGCAEAHWTEDAAGRSAADLLHGYQDTALLYVAAKLGLADFLANWPKTSEKLAAMTGAHALVEALGSSAVADPVAAVLARAQTFPLSFQAPLARVSVKLSNKVRWNAGWEFYRYREDFNPLSVFEDYRAHTGYVSLLWAF